MIKDNGGDIITSSPVEEIIVTNNRATGVRIRGGVEIRARRAVLTACSPKTTLTRLLPRGVLEHKKQNAANHIPNPQARNRGREGERRAVRSRGYVQAQEVAR